MLTKTETVATIWVGMSKEQRGDILTAIVAVVEQSAIYEDVFSDQEKEAINALRLALLNV